MNRTPRRPEPAIPADVTWAQVDASVKQELRTLSKENAQGVAGHLVMAARLLDEDLVAARAHAETAVRRAGRVAAVREMRGMVAYREGDWMLALSEFRTARRLSGSAHLLPLLVDTERALGRHERALDLAASPDAGRLTIGEQVELRIVLSGLRRDLGQHEAAAVALRIPQLKPGRREPWAPRLYYAYAESLFAVGDLDGARAWFAHAVDADPDLTTDAAERLDELDGVLIVDWDEDPDDAEPTTAKADGHDDGEPTTASDDAEPTTASVDDPDPAP